MAMSCADPLLRGGDVGDATGEVIVRLVRAPCSILELLVLAKNASEAVVLDRTLGNRSALRSVRKLIDQNLGASLVSRRRVDGPIIVLRPCALAGRRLQPRHPSERVVFEIGLDSGCVTAGGHQTRRRINGPIEPKKAQSHAVRIEIL